MNKKMYEATENFIEERINYHNENEPDAVSYARKLNRRENFERMGKPTFHEHVRAISVKQEINPHSHKRGNQRH